MLSLFKTCADTLYNAQRVTLCCNFDEFVLQGWHSEYFANANFEKHKHQIRKYNGLVVLHTDFVWHHIKS